MPRTAVFLTLAVALIIVALAAGAWELRRLDHSVQAVRADVQEIRGEPRTSADLGRVLKTLAVLTEQTAKLRESGLRLEFQLPIQAYVTRLVVAVEAGHLKCAEAKQRWQNYVNDRVVPFLNKPKRRDLKAALRHDDPDCQATLLNDLSVSC